MLLLQPADGPQYYRFDNLSIFAGLVHGVFTREGGTSELSFKSLNVSLSTGDDRENVDLNRKMVAESMGVDQEHAIYLNQVHGEKFVVLKQDRDSGAIEDSSEAILLERECSDSYRSDREIAEEGADGIITDIKGVLTVMQVADCQAVILYDPVQQVIANIHSGWRGSIMNIIGRGVKIMKEQFESAPHNILAAISPSLGPCCGEFRNYREEIPEQLWSYRRGEYYFDFWQMSRDQLTEQGVLPQNIEVAEICTSCRSNIFYSYRKENITGRFAVAAGLICNGCDVKVKEKSIFTLT